MKTSLLITLVLLTCSACATSQKSYRVTYEVGGTAKSVNLTYTNESGGTEQRNADLPWSKTFSARDGDFLYISAQDQGGSGDVVAYIILNGNTKKSAHSSGPYTIATSSYTCCD